MILVYFLLIFQVLNPIYLVKSSNDTNDNETNNDFQNIIYLSRTPSNENPENSSKIPLLENPWEFYINLANQSEIEKINQDGSKIWNIYYINDIFRFIESESKIKGQEDKPILVFLSN